jgi:hypothetical protein
LSALLWRTNLKEEKGDIAMKMTSIEKKMIAVMAVAFVVFVMSIYSLGKSLDEAGGVKGLIVEAGKEIKDIKKQIETAP